VELKRGDMSRKLKKKKVKKNRKFGFPRGECPNCREKGAHFVPPSFGDPGFFICESKRIEPFSHHLSGKEINK